MIAEIRTPLRVFFNVSRSLDVFLALLLSSALYSLIILLMAFGSPALEIPKNIK